MPRIGIEPRTGTLWISSCISSSTNPPNTIIWLLSTKTVVSIVLLFVIKSVVPVRGPATPETSCFISKITEFPSLICGFIESLIPTSSLDVVLKGFVLFEPKLSPVVMGISWPITVDASSLSIANSDVVVKILEFLSASIALIIAIILSSSSDILPIPAIMPWEFKSELAAIFEKLALSPDSIADPVKPSRSGPVPFWNLVIPIGISPSSAPAKIVSTPKLLAAVSESSTTIASTNTWALLISSLDIRFFMVAIFDSSLDTTTEFVGAWYVTIGFSDSEEINLEAIELTIPATSSASAYLRYITATEPSLIASASNCWSVSLIMFVVIELADTITEFDALKEIATKLFIVGLFWDFSFSRILTASTDDRFFKSTIVTLAVLSSSNDSTTSVILSTLLFLSTISKELIDAILETFACLPAIGLISGKSSTEDLFLSSITLVINSPPDSPEFWSLVASFSGTILTKFSSLRALKPLTCIVRK